MTTLKLLRFTFQYVSINTKNTDDIETEQENLHSNMFLLIPLTRVISSKVRTHLHSNMFLLIQRLAEDILFDCCHLHSNMFLLIQRKRCITGL